jgi:branched-chain amino acid transport system permease protein
MPPVGILALGLVQGALAGFNALGFVLLWRTTRVVNLAQPALGLVGGVLVGLLVVSGGWAFWWALPVGLVMGGLLGFASERLVLSRLRDAPRVIVLVATLGLAQLLGAIQLALPFAFGASEHGLPTYTVDLGKTWFLDPVLLLGPHLLTLVLFPIAVAGVLFFLHRTRYGLAALALGQDTERAQALGIPAPAIRGMVWTLAGMLSALAGILSIPVLGFSLGAGTGPTVLLLALAPAVFAGLRSIAGAAAASLGLGVLYQTLLWKTQKPGVAELMLGAAVLLAVALQRRRLGRAETAARATSWEAAATVRPLPRKVARNPRLRVAAIGLAVVAAVAAAAPPLLLGPGDDITYGTSTAFVLAALAVSVAWVFAGELALGQWGVVGFAATVAAVTPGPLLVRAIVAIVAITGAGAALAVVSRRQASLGFAVIGLAIAAAAPIAFDRVTRTDLSLGPQLAGSIGGVLIVLGAVAATRLRATVLGARLVAAREDGQRARWLGTDPTKARALGLGLSFAIAASAGVIYLASLGGAQPGIDAFEASRSLNVLAMAVIGGLGNPLGAVIGAALLRAGTIWLPGPWALLTSGAGVLLVVLFLPAGLSRIIEKVRNLGVRLLVGANALDRPRPAVATSPSTSSGSGVDGVARVRPLVPAPRPHRARIAGSDTREALGTRTVRLTSLAAALAFGPGLFAILAAGPALRDWADLPSVAVPWMILGMGGLAAAVAVVAWRWDRLAPSLAGNTSQPDRPARIADGAGGAFDLLLLAGAGAISGEPRFVALLLPAVVLLASWSVGRMAAFATSACHESTSAAASGLVVTGALWAIVPAGHLALVTAGSGLPRASGWAAIYAAGAIIALVVAARAQPSDRRRFQSRLADKGPLKLDPANGIVIGAARTVDLTAAAARNGGTNGLTTNGNGNGNGNGKHVVTPALLLDRVTVSFSGNRVLDDTTLVVAPGEVVALCGGNGAGKSTMLRVAAGLIEPERGRIEVNGEDISSLQPEERAAVGLAFVSGARPVFPDLTVMENLRVAAFASHTTTRSFETATERILDLVPAIARRRNHKAALLSGGEQRLLAIAQTLYRRPIALLADELTLGLDVEARESALDLLRVLADDGVGVVAVDHDLPALLGRAHRAVLIAEGATYEFGQPAELLERRRDLLPAQFLAGMR